LPHLKVAQSTADMDWTNVELRVFSSDTAPVSGLFTSPQTDVVNLELNGSASGYKLKSDPLAGKVKWQVTRPGIK
jgi:alpha-D-xyloside xylohydrolase